MKAPSLATVATVFFVVTPVVGVIITLCWRANSEWRST